jgi:hypothetical protein
MLMNPGATASPGAAIVARARACDSSLMATMVSALKLKLKLKLKLTADSG